MGEYKTYYIHHFICRWDFYFDLAYKCFPEFELPFIVISLIVLLFPLLLFVGYIIISRIVVKALKRKCKRRIQK